MRRIGWGALGIVTALGAAVLAAGAVFVVWLAFWWVAAVVLDAIG